MDLRLNRSASLPPSSAAGKDSTEAEAMSKVEVPSSRPSLVVRKKVSMGQTKEPMAVTSLPMKRMYISFFMPPYWVINFFIMDS